MPSEPLPPAATAPRPDRRGETRRELLKASAPRPDRVDLKPMTVRVDARTWRFFKKLAPDLDTTQEKLLRRALRLFMSKFNGVPESEYQAIWEAIGKEAAGDS
jgi:hypothetical protein